MSEDFKYYVEKRKQSRDNCKGLGVGGTDCSSK